MTNNFFVKDDRYILNYCAKYLARSNRECRHVYGTPGDAAPCEHTAEAWRFPIVDSYSGGAPGIYDAATFGSYNEVTFIYAGADAQSPPDVSVIGTFATLYDPIPMRQVTVEGEPSRYWTLTCVVPKCQVHRYRFVVEGIFFVNDPINPQQETLDNGIAWSRFFTESFTSPLVMEHWELDILHRLATEILPFQTAEASNFLARFYNYLDRADRDSVYANVYRLDDSAGEVNFIDNILAREERHHLIDYKICLRIIDRVLRQRNPFTEPGRMSRDAYFDMYSEMASNKVEGWDYQAYSSPQFFLYLLRRHVVTGAFCHPKYGGNTGAAGWAYLSERYTARPEFSDPPVSGQRISGQPLSDQPSQTLFDWRRSMEKPLGIDADYIG